MMLTKFLIAAGFVAAAAAQDWATYAVPDPAVQADFSGQPAPDFTDVAKVKRESFALLAERNNPGPQKDPYECWNCGKYYNYHPVPAHPKCNGNNCYRAFLNGRDGSSEKHCPSNGMGFCCAWYKLCDNDKHWFVAHGWVRKYAPWTVKCGPDKYTCDADVKETIEKIDEVCACTIRHTITVDTTTPYYGLRKEWPFSPKCKA